MVSRVMENLRDRGESALPGLLLRMWSAIPECFWDEKEHRYEAERYNHGDDPGGISGQVTLSWGILLPKDPSPTQRLNDRSANERYQILATQ